MEAKQLTAEELLKYKDDHIDTLKGIIKIYENRVKDYAERVEMYREFSTPNYTPKIAPAHLKIVYNRFD